MRTVGDHPVGVYGGAVDYQGIMTIEPGKRGGKPVIRGLRITVDDVLSYLAAGMTVDQIVADFPPLAANDVLAVLAYAATRERSIATVPRTTPKLPSQPAPRRRSSGIDMVRSMVDHSHMTGSSVIVEARLRGRNQLTLPELIVQAGGLAEGERFAVEIDPADPDTVHLHRLRTSYAGALRDVYGDPAAALAEERTGWR